MQAPPLTSTPLLPQADLFTSPLPQEKEVLPYRIYRVRRIIDFLCLINEPQWRNWLSDPPTVSYREYSNILIGTFGS